jgi:hypothetical protein
MLLPHSASSNEASGFAFSATEIARLEIYRDAIRARFYNDNVCHEMDTSIGTPTSLTESAAGRQDAANAAPNA